MTWKQTRARRDSTWHLAQEEWGGTGQKALGMHPEGGGADYIVRSMLATATCCPLKRSSALKGKPYSRLKEAGLLADVRGDT